MASRCVTANISAGYTEKTFYDGDTILFGTNVSSESAVEGTVVSAVLNISDFRVYSGSCYMDVYIGGTKVAETVEMDLDDFGSGSATWVSVELEYLKSALLTASGSIELICYNNNSATARTYGTELSSFCEVVVEYEEPVVDPLIQWGKTLTVVQENYQAKITWDEATPINGAGAVSYAVTASYTQDDETIETTVYTGTATSITIDPPMYGIAVAYCVYAYSSGAENSGTGTLSKSLTITLPEYAHYIVRCYINDAWQDCLFYYYDGTDWIECVPYYYDGSSWQTCSF